MSIGSKFGRAVGIAGALVVEGAVRTATAAGQFGEDALKGAEDGFAEKRVELLASRAVAAEAAKARREEALRQHKAAMAAAPDAPKPIAAKRAAKAAS